MKKLLSAVVLGIAVLGNSYAGESALSVLKSEVSPAARESSVSQLPKAVVSAENGRSPSAIMPQSAAKTPFTGSKVQTSRETLPMEKSDTAIDISSFQDKNFGPDEIMLCGWHVEVDGDFIIMTTILNPRFERQWYINNSNPHACEGAQTVVAKCTGKECVGMKNFHDELPAGEKDSIRLLNDGNLMYINSSGVIFKNYRVN